MEPLKHECGIAAIRLRKPLSYYQEKYGTWRYGLNKLYLLMEKQHNRGQEGAGLACIKIDCQPGDDYLFRARAEGSSAIPEIFDIVQRKSNIGTEEEQRDMNFVQGQVPFAGECYMGHLRYSTTNKKGLTFVHPMIRRNNWRAKSLAICGNFNLTNVDNVFKSVTSVGQYPRHISDMHILVEQLGHRLDREVERIYTQSKEHKLTGMDITNFIEERMDLANVLRTSAPLWDGGYAMCGVTGSGESYTMRDPWGIRPAFYYIDEEIIVVASERPVIQTVMNVTADKIIELKPGEALLVNKAGEHRLEQIIEAKPFKACSFERIYFSRGSDRDIYQERKALGRRLTDPILKSVDYDIDNTVFSFVPNTAEVAYYGMLEGLNEHLNGQKLLAIQGQKDLSDEELKQILARKVRSEKVVIKDIKLRTFISESKSREDLASHVYDITYGSVRRHIDKLVVIDDSIVRGTTIKQSIFSILDRLDPTKIVVVSSCPQIRYPDYYGIDMTKMKEFIAFRATIELIKERGMEDLLMEQYKKALTLRELPWETPVENVVKAIYKPFTADEISQKIVELLRPKGMKADAEIIFQSMEGLHEAIPHNKGDWYFSGDYPTAGGSHLVNQAFINYMEEDYL